jgi:hypothetical protein
MITSDRPIFLNGVSGLTGQRLLPPLDPKRIAAIARGEIPDKPTLRWLKRVWKALTEPHLGLPFGVRPEEPRQAGWGIVFHASDSDVLEDALSGLIEHRRAQIGDERTHVFVYKPGEDWRGWLARHGAEPGAVRPDRVPYYLLLAGDPERLPFELEHMLSVERAVGRLSFDRLDRYRLYAESLIAYETGARVPQDRQAVFFATRHDPATETSADLLAKPLEKDLPSLAPGFASRGLWANNATKANLGEVFRPGPGSPAPAFLFTASHGVAWPKGHPDQAARQGALLCQGGFGNSHADHCFSASDVPDDARVHGLVTFHFACFGAGTPHRDSFTHKLGELPPEIAERPFVAALPKRLLSHPQGGALAVIGHVDRAWGYSLVGLSGTAQIQPFRNAVAATLAGVPVGHAVQDFHQRFAALSTGLGEMLRKVSFGFKVPDEELAELWLERNDAQSYTVLGDPAARLRVGALEEAP